MADMAVIAAVAADGDVSIGPEQLHRCHHALHENCFNTNFATILSIWDRIGRSYHLAGDRREMERIGLPKPRGPVTMQMVPFLLIPVEP